MFGGGCEGEEKEERPKLCVLVEEGDASFRVDGTQR